jgi:hypothetical protein
MPVALARSRGTPSHPYRPKGGEFRPRNRPESTVVAEVLTTLALTATPGSLGRAN